MQLKHKSIYINHYYFVNRENLHTPPSPQKKQYIFVDCNDGSIHFLRLFFIHILTHTYILFSLTVVSIDIYTYTTYILYI